MIAKLHMCLDRFIDRRRRQPFATHHREHGAARRSRGCGVSLALTSHFAFFDIFSQASRQSLCTNLMLPEHLQG